MTRTAIAIAALTLTAAACGGAPPPVRHYQIALPDDDAAAGQGDRVLAVERLRTDAAYDDARIVYRESPYRLDYYHYHRWTAPPGTMIGDYLRIAYQNSGLFASVVSGYTERADAILAGRLMALEEVSIQDGDWLARVRLELRVRDARSGDILWSRVITETEPLADRNPEAVAASLAAAMARIVGETAPAIAERIAPD